jgi:hypothetical protein
MILRRMRKIPRRRMIKRARSARRRGRRVTKGR